MDEQKLKQALDNIYGPDDLHRDWEESEPIILMDINGPIMDGPMNLGPGGLNYVRTNKSTPAKRRRSWWQELRYRWRLALMALKGEIDHED